MSPKQFPFQSDDSPLDLSSQGDNPWDIPTPKGEQLTYIRKGVLWVQKEPHYIVELIKEQTGTYVMVYNVHPNTKDDPKKLANEVKRPRQVFSSRTKLGVLANNLIAPKETMKWEPKPPVFVAPVLPNQTATLTGRIESGFYEREPDETKSQGGKLKLVRGRNTGVFIGLSSIEWESKYTIPTSSVVETLTKHKQGMFYDLEGKS